MIADGHRFISLGEFVTIVKEASRSIPKIHGKRPVTYGFLAEQVKGLEVVGALLEKQQDWVDGDLQQQAEGDIQLFRAQAARLGSVANRIRLNQATAEDVLGSLRAESDVGQAVGTLRKLMFSNNKVSIDGVAALQESGGGKPGVEVPAAKLYVLDLSAIEVRDDGSAVCLLRGGEDVEPIFVGDDFDQRRLNVKEAGDRRMVLSYCFLHGIEFKASVSLVAHLTAQGVSFRASIVRFEELDALLTRIRRANEAFASGLFADATPPSFQSR